jgi:hypothetical protein
MSALRFAYADPPYIGQAARHYGSGATAERGLTPDPLAAEVDHAELLARLEGFDGWALSMSAAMYSLKEIAALAPDEARMAAWVKPFASFKRGVAVAYTWEPVLFRTRRAWSRDVATVRDHLIAPAVVENITLQRGTSGAKPERFCLWLFDLLGMTDDDEFHDLYPGSGAVTRAHEAWRASQRGEVHQTPLFRENVA